jgi:hypothetical protein
MLPFAFDEFDLVGVAVSMSWTLSIDDIVGIKADSHRQGGLSMVLGDVASVISGRYYQAGDEHATRGCNTGR